MLVEREVLDWPGVAKEPDRFDTIADKLGRREIAHVHHNGVADFPFPRTVHDELIAAGRAHPHQAGVPGVANVAEVLPARRRAELGCAGLVLSGQRSQLSGRLLA